MSSRVANFRDQTLLPVQSTSPNRRRPSQTKGQIRQAKRRRRRNAKLYHEAVALAGDLGMELGKNPGTIPEVLEKVFRRTHALWAHAASQVDNLSSTANPGTKNSLWALKYDEQGNRIVEPSKWVMLETALREELFEQGARMTQLNLDARRVKIEETQLEMLSRALALAAKRANLSDEQQRDLGSALRTELAIIEGTTSELVPATTTTPAQPDAKAA